MSVYRAPLPIDDHVDEIRDALDRSGVAVLVAPPGTGKTTRVPPALIDRGRTILLQPRRLAARSLARRIAGERGWTLGEQVGWQVRYERRFNRDTQLLVATEGVLTARLQDDPLLGEFRTAVLDEFHERSLHADLALALLEQARAARDDLRVLVMSATLDAARVADFLGGCPILEVQARPYALDVEYEPFLDVAGACRREVARAEGDVLCFLPGAPEIRRTAERLRGGSTSTRILPLHGSLDSAKQDAALTPSSERRLILATNLAETSLTVPGVRTVVDSGLHKVLRVDEGSGFDRLETERISRDSADQRAGRAARIGPGRAIRLWDERDELRPHREAEIRRVDLAGPFVDVLAWGEDPRAFGWFEAPDPERTARTMVLLERLGLVRDAKLTPLGRRIHRLPVHPRLGRLLHAAGFSREAVVAAAMLAEGWIPDGPAEAGPSDLLWLADSLPRAPGPVRRAVRDLQRRTRDLTDETTGAVSLERATWAAYPDRLAQRREPRSSRLRLVGGGGAILDERSAVRDGELLVAVDIRAARRGSTGESYVRLAGRVDPSWLEPTHEETTHRIEDGVVRAYSTRYHDAIPLDERSEPVDPDRAAQLVADAMLADGWSEENRAVLARLAFAGIDVDAEALLRAACVGRDRTFAFRLVDALHGPDRRSLDERAPAWLDVPSGRRVPLEYREDGTVHASVKLQEVFGLADSPRLGRQREPVTFSLLAPNGRPVQTTRDLSSFWNSTYAEVRRELRGRYPKHPWPEDPWTAQPTARTRRRR